MKSRSLAVAGLLLWTPLFSTAMPAKKSAAKPSTAAEAEKFIADVETRLFALSTDASRAGWVQSTYITDDTEILAAQASERLISATARWAKEAARFDGVELSAELARKIRLLKLALTLAAPQDPKEAEELTRITAAMEGMYGKAKYCPEGKDKCLDLEEITRIMANSRDEKELLDVWRGWHSTAIPMRKDFVRYIELANKGAQDWSNIYPLVSPKDADPGYDLTEILKGRKTDPQQMVRYGEGFFTSLGFAPLPKSFWERSLFTKPRDRDVVCHASAWDIDDVEDLRVKMCISKTAEDFTTIHHELGHNFYQRAYSKLPFLFRDSANDGFHEAVGDTIALSITPEYLVKLGFLTKAPDESKDIGLLLRKALEKIAFLPFGVAVDQWRW